MRQGDGRLIDVELSVRTADVCPEHSRHDDSCAIEATDPSRRRGLIIAAVLGVIGLADQSVKWLAWRHLDTARINPGGNALTGGAIDRWLTDPWPGALLDVADSLVLIGLIAVLARLRRPTRVVLAGTVMVGGWASNLADRLGTHYWSAPGSMRGAIDFLHIGPHYYNLADLLILVATPLFVLGLVLTRGPARAAGRAHRSRAPLLVWTCAPLLLAGVAAHGAQHYGWLSIPQTVINAQS